MTTSRNEDGITMTRSGNKDGIVQDETIYIDSAGKGINIFQEIEIIGDQNDNIDTITVFKATLMSTVEQIYNRLIS